MRLYRRMGRFRHRRFFNAYNRDLFQWLLSLEQGAIIGSCTGFNHRVAEVKPFRHRIGAKGWYIYSIRVTDTEGRWHWAPGGGCVSRPYPREEILEFARSWADSIFWGALLDAEGTPAPFLSSEGLYIGPPRKMEPSLAGAGRED